MDYADYEAAFVTEIRRNPTTNLPRLIYADYLEEQGEPLSELIRCQCALEGLIAGDPDYRRLREQETALLDAHGERWLEPLRQLGALGVSRRCFHKGLIEKVVITAADFLRHGRELCEIAPALHRLQLKQAVGFVPQLTAYELPAQIRALDFTANQLTPPEVQRLTQARWIVQVEELNLHFNRLGRAGLDRLRLDSWVTLKRLSLSSNALEGGSTRYLLGDSTTSRLSSRLEVLQLNVNNLNDGDAACLAESHWVERLKTLELASNQLGDPGAAALADSPALTALELLNLRSNKINQRGMNALRQHRLPALKKLDLRGNPAAVPEELQQLL